MNWYARRRSPAIMRADIEVFLLTNQTRLICEATGSMVAARMREGELYASPDVIHEYRYKHHVPMINQLAQTLDIPERLIFNSATQTWSFGGLIVPEHMSFMIAGPLTVLAWRAKDRGVDQG